jgi:hypothetical protein
LDLSALEAKRLRLSWPANSNQQFQIFTGANLAQPLALLTNVPGKFPETELILSGTNSRQFYRLGATPY